MSVGSLRETLVVQGWAVLDRLPGRAGRSVLRAGSEVLLTVLAVAGLAVGALTLVVSQSGVRPLVVRSGSMEPFIATGSMVLMQEVDASALKVGDVVTVTQPGGGRVTHRVTALAPAGDGAVRVTTKGDANDKVDPFRSTIRRVDRLVWRAPVVGRLAAGLATPRGGFLMGCLATVIACRALGRRLR